MNLICVAVFALKVKVVSNSIQARVNSRSNYGNVISVQCSECQSGEIQTSAGKRQEKP